MAWNQMCIDASNLQKVRVTKWLDHIKCDFSLTCTLRVVCNSEMHCHPRFRPQGNSQCAQPKHYSLITPSVLVPHMG